MVHDDLFERVKARQAFAQAVTPAVQTILDQAVTLSALFERTPYDRNQRQVIPLEQYWDIRETDYVQVWSMETAGGLPTNHGHGLHEIPFITFPLGSAVELGEDYVRDANLNVIANEINKMGQEVLQKREDYASQVFLRALAEAETSYGDQTYKHIIRGNKAGEFTVTDYNSLATRASRINASWSGGTPAGTMSRGFSDLMISPEKVEDLRNAAFNPLNTKGSDDLAGPEAARNQIWQASGAPNIYGVNVLQFNELGIDQKWNDTFDEFAGSTEYDGSAFDKDTEEIILAIDRRPKASPYGLLRMVEQGGHFPETFQVRPDDQYFSRQKTVGFWGEERTGFVICDVRPVTGIIIEAAGS